MIVRCMHLTINYKPQFVCPSTRLHTSILPPVDIDLEYSSGYHIHRQKPVIIHYQEGSTIRSRINAHNCVEIP
jgi:hypothetical protein